MQHELDRTSNHTRFIGERAYRRRSGFCAARSCWGTLYTAHTEQGTMVWICYWSGAALSDIGYALITGYGMSFMDDFLAKNQVLLQIIGSIMLFFFGIYTFRSNPVQSIRPVSSTPGSYLHNFVTAFFVTLSNPLIIFLFIGLFARFSFVMPGSPIGFQLVGYLAIVLGALLWWFGITYFVNKVRTRFNLRGIWILNRVIGIVVMLISVAGFIYTILGKTMY